VKVYQNNDKISVTAPIWVEFNEKKWWKINLSSFLLYKHQCHLMYL
jgi:hypothetical protein